MGHIYFGDPAGKWVRFQSALTAGRPLEQVLAALGRPTGPLAYAFFTSPIVCLAGLSPIQALIGCALNASEEAREFLRGDGEERLRVVIMAAGAYAARLAV